MADKKDSSGPDMVTEIGFIVLILIFLWVIWSVILNYLLTLTDYSSYLSIWYAIVAWFVKYAYPVLVGLSIIVTLLAIAGTIVNYRKLSKLINEENKIYGSPVIKNIEEVTLPKKNERWEGVEKHINSANPSDWRLAIIEADLILEDMLKAQGYRGESIGEMLKAVERSDMVTLDHAWEAHKTRNEVVHSGSEYALNEREARRIIALYESVFREFKMI